VLILRENNNQPMAVRQLADAVNERGLYDGGPEVHWTKAYTKFCSRARGELEQWAATTIGDCVTFCRSCFS